jgi:hypothetical protein
MTPASASFLDRKRLVKYRRAVSPPRFADGLHVEQEEKGDSREALALHLPPGQGLEEKPRGSQRADDGEPPSEVGQLGEDGTEAHAEDQVAKKGETDQHQGDLQGFLQDRRPVAAIGQVL